MASQQNLLAAPKPTAPASRWQSLLGREVNRRWLARNEPEVLLKQHTIEPELLGARPRWIRRFWPDEEFSGAILPHLLLPAIHLFLLIELLCSEIVTSPSSWVVILCFSIFSISSLLSIRDIWAARARQYRLLREGRAVSAVIIDTKPREKNRTRLDFICLDRSGSRYGGTISIPDMAILSHSLRIGSTFTLLVSPESDEEYLPYFVVRGSIVTPIYPTSASRHAADAIAAATVYQTLPAPPLGHIEPELLGATPRPIRRTSTARKHFFRYGFVFALLTTLSALFYMPQYGILGLLFWISPGAFLIGALVTLFLDAQVISDRRLLRTGIPARAKVIGQTDMTPDSMQPVSQHQIAVYFQFRTQMGTSVIGYVLLPRQRVWHLGLELGTTFTVLYDPDQPQAATPYFHISHFESIGSAGFQIAKP